MATAEEASDTVTCPLCDDYEGQPTSVEAHISRMTDPVHRGEVGRVFRDHIQDRVVGSEDVESSEDSASESTEKNAVESSENDGSSESTEGFQYGPEDGEVPSQDTDGMDGDRAGDEFDVDEPMMAVPGDDDEDLRDEFEELAGEFEEIVSETEAVEERVDGLEERVDELESEHSDTGTDEETDEETDDGVGEESAGIPIPVPATYLFAGVAVAFGFLWLSRQSSGGQQKQTQQSQQSQQNRPFVDPEGL